MVAKRLTVRNCYIAALPFATPCHHHLARRSSPWLVMLSIVLRMARCKLCSALRLCPTYDSVMQAPDLDKGLQQVGWRKEEESNRARACRTWLVRPHRAA